METIVKPVTRFKQEETFRYHLLMTLVFAVVLALLAPYHTTYAYHEQLGATGEFIGPPPPPPVTKKVEVKAASAAPAGEDPLVYVVNPGDTLYQISKNFGLSMYDLQAWNGIDNPSRLAVGQKLSIPAIPDGVPLINGKEPVIEKVLTSTLTAYTAGVESTGKGPSHPAYGITYSGVKAEEGRTVAVDPKVIPIGSTVYIEGVGIRRAEDTGSAIKGSKIDVFIEDVTEARQFGVKKNVKVFVLSPA